MDKDKESRNLGSRDAGTRKFPIALLIIAAIFSSVASAYAGMSSIALSLAYLMFTVSFFLVLISVFFKLKMIKTKRDEERIVERGESVGSSEQAPDFGSHFFSPLVKSFYNAWTRVTSFYLEERISSKLEITPLESTETKQEGAANALLSDGLTEIQKNNVSERDQRVIKHAGPRYEVLYLASFTGIALWRLSGMFTIVPLSSAGFHYSIVDAVLLLVFPCVAITYLKMRKNEGARPGDKTSRDALTLLSYVSLVYAAVIAVSLTLNANITVALQWLFYAAMVYLTAAFAGNILLSVLAKKVIGDFNYRLIPIFSKTDGNETSFWDSQDARVNFSLKSLYTVKYTLKVIPGLVLGLIGVLFLSTAIFVVQPHQRAAVYRFGKLDRSSIVGEGIHLKLPWPIDQVRVFDVYRVRSTRIGQVSFADAADGVWAQFHTGDEHLLLLGNGNEKVSVNMMIFYRISDLYAYLTTSAAPRAILSAAAYEALMNRTVNTTLDAFLNIDRSGLSASILAELAEFSQRERLGLSVAHIIIEGIHPPADVTDVYHMVISASIDKNTIITDARTEAERKLIDADRQSVSIVNYAKARQHYRISAAAREMAVFHAAVEAHGINPGSFELTRYLDVFERVIRESRTRVFSPAMEGSIHRSVLGQTDTPGVVGF